MASLLQGLFVTRKNFCKPVLMLVPNSPRSRFPGQFLAHEGLYAVYQLIELDDLTGRLTTDENRALMLDLAPPSAVTHALTHSHSVTGPIANSTISLVSTGYSLFQTDKNISLVYKKH
jgi:hypothetical protein